MAVVEPIWGASQQLRAEIEESLIGTTPRQGNWEARIAGGQPVVRVLVRDRWWELCLKDTRSGAQIAAYEKFASGAADGELFFYRAPTRDTQLGNGSGPCLNGHSEIRCQMVTWLPRDPFEDSNGPQDALSGWANHIEEMDIRDLRKALRVNRVSFPSQVPTFVEHDQPGLQRKLAQLYFVLGWSSSDIGRRYELRPTRVRQILDLWRRRAVRAGYIQYIPSAEAASQQVAAAASPHTFPTATPDLLPQFAQASFSIAAGGFQHNDHGIRAQ